MATSRKEVTTDWLDLCDTGDTVIVQNVTDTPIELKVGSDATDGYILTGYESFSYTGDEQVSIRALRNTSVIVVDCQSNS